MPGAFHFDAPNGAEPLGGVHAGIFRPPISPSASSSMYMTKSTGSLHSEAMASPSNVKRKRYGARESTPLHGWAAGNEANYNADGGEYDRPQPGRRTSSGREIRYTLAGQIETPNGAPQPQRPWGDACMEDSAYSDVDYRRALGSRRSNEDVDSPLSKYATVGSHHGEQTQEAPGWSRFALSTIGGVVGKVWEFCKEGAFLGFYAGGGRGYEMQPLESNGQVWCNEHDVPTLPNYGTSSIPGGFPESDYFPPHYERNTPEYTPPPAAKRRQIYDKSPNDELRKNWVMVNDPADKMPQAGYTPTAPPSRPPLNRRISKPVSRLSVPTLGRRHSNRVSHAGGATLTNREPASFASPRSPVVSNRTASPSRLPLPTRPESPNPFSPRHSHQPSRIPSPSPYSPRGHRRNLSAASAASAASGATMRMKKRESSAVEIVEESSPRLDPEAKHIVVRRMKQERETDARIQDFNSRLLDMIRQGKEALGTTVEVEGDVGFDTGAGLDPWEDE
jgi:hypothetical protein